MTENFVHGCCWYIENRPKPGSVGKLYPGIEARLRNDGEICFKSDTMMAGYYKNPEQTATELIDGWYHTGDHGKDLPLLLTNLSEGGSKLTREALESELLLALEAINCKLPRHKQISHVFIISKEWTIEDGLHSPTIKIRRKAIAARFTSWVDTNLGLKVIGWKSAIYE